MFNCLVFPISFISGFGILGLLIFLYIKNGTPELWYGIGFMLIWTLIMVSCSGFSVLNYSIIIDPLFGAIIVKANKMLFCFSKKEVYQFTEIKKVMVNKDIGTHKINGVNYRSFKIEFLLQTDRVVKILTGVIDKNNESRKAFDIFRNNLPSNILFESDLNEKKMNYY